MQLRVKNFQSWKDQEFELKPFTAIVGRSNSGKTAIVRALEALLYNVSDANYLRRGRKSYSISLDDGKNVLEYTKAKSPKYTVNDQKFSPGRGSSDRVGELGYAEIQAESSKIRAQISRQYDPPFLIHSSYSPSVTGAVLNNLSESSDAQKAKRAVEKDVKSITSDTNHKERDLSDIKKQLGDRIIWEDIVANYKKFEGLTLVLKEREEFQVLTEKISAGKKIQAEIKRLQQVTEDRKKFEMFSKEYNAIKGTITQIKDVKEQIKLIDYLRSLIERMGKWLAEAKKKSSGFVEVTEEYVQFLRMFKIIEQGKEMNRVIKVEKTKLLELRHNFHLTVSKLGSIPVCPTCGRIR